MIGQLKTSMKFLSPYPWGRDHYFLMENFQKKFLNSKNCWKKNPTKVAMEKTSSKVLFINQALCLTLNSIVQAIAHNAQLKGEEKFMPENYPTSPQKIYGPSLREFAHTR